MMPLPVLARTVAIEGITPPALDDVLPPVPPPGVPLWGWAAIAAAILCLAIACWLLWKRSHPRLQTREFPAARALRLLREARSRVETDPPYQFSIAVCDVLRTFVDEEFGLRSSRQTSPEFLAAIRGHARFSGPQQELLRQFLERCDRIKFGGGAPDRAENPPLLDDASRFVEACTQVPEVLPA